MRSSLRLVVLVTCLTALLGCGDVTGPAASQGDASRTPPGTADPSVRLVAEEEAQLHLWVSNQSFADDSVRLSITVDGVEVVDQVFDVEGQHNWQLFSLALPSGNHELSATSDTGAAITRTFPTETGTTRFAVVDYWFDEGDDAPSLEWRIQDEPLAFG